jgi:hypothetical protein
VKREPLQPLIPLDDLKRVVAGLVAVPKSAVDKLAEKSRSDGKRAKEPKLKDAD